MSTINHVNTPSTGKHDRDGNLITKPAAVLQSNKGKSGVDASDQVAAKYSPARKTIKWYRMLGFDLILMSAVNSYRIHRILGGRMEFLEFTDIQPNLPQYRGRS